MPVLLVHGDRDPQAPMAIGTKLFTRFGTPDKWWVILPGADHAAHLEKSAAAAGADRRLVHPSSRDRTPMKRRHAVAAAIALADRRQHAARAAGRARPRVPAPFNVFEASIAEMQAAMKSGRTTSRAIVQQYLTRIAMYEDKLHAAITVNPKALEEAEARDRERAQGRILGPLHGIPIALKDNIHTTDMPTTGGALAFEHLVPPYEATLTKNLRDAGAVIIAKTGMTELANYVTGGMPTNYNAVHGYGMNPVRSAARSAHERRRPSRSCRPADRAPASARRRISGPATSAPKRPGRSSVPSNQNMLAAVKPTVGRISRYGVIPITADQDTPGPMAKFVADVAIMMGALEGAAPDPNDAATKACTPPPGNDYTKFLRADGLKGARIGIPRKNYYEPFTIPGTRSGRAAASIPRRRR